MKLLIPFVFRKCCNLPLIKNDSTSRNFKRFIYMINHTNEYNQANEVEVIGNRVEDKLIKNGVPYVNGHTCYHINGCCAWQKPAKKIRKVHAMDNPNIYVNKKTGFFLCNNCKVTGSWFKLSDYIEKGNCFCKEEETEQSEVHKYDKPLQEWENIKRDSKLIDDFSDSEIIDIFNSFRLTWCSAKRLSQLQIRISNNKTQLYVPLFTFDSIVGYKTLYLTGVTKTYPSTNCSGVFIYEKPHTTAVVVSQVKDFFALLSQNLDMTVLCLPHGLSNLPQSTLPFLEKYEKLILWLGGGEALDATNNFAKKLGEKRCMIIKPTNKQTTALTALLNGENIWQIVHNAKSAWHESIISFQSLREEVLSELQNKDQCNGITWKRFPALNKILRGHRRGELTVLTGPTGSGKTTFISEYSLDLAMQGVNTLWGSFEIKNARLAKKMLQQFSRIPMEENLDKFNFWADKFEQLPIYFMTFHGQQSLKKVMDAVEHCSYVHDIAHVIIDNVQFMIEVSLEAGMDRFWKQDVLIQAFRNFASKCNCHVTLVMHPKKGMDGFDLSINSIFGGAKAAQEADNILIIQNKSSHSYMSKKMLQISKNRFSGELGAMPLNFDKDSFGFSKEPVDTVYLDKRISDDMYSENISKYNFDSKNWNDHNEWRPMQEESQRTYFDKWNKFLSVPDQDQAHSKLP